MPRLLDSFEDLQEIHNIIVFQTGHSVENIANKIKYSRAHLQKILTGREAGKGKIEVLDKLKIAYQEEITQFVRKYSTVANSELPDPAPQKQEEQILEVVRELALSVNRIEQKIDRVFPGETGSFFDAVRKAIGSRGSGSKRGKSGRQK